MKREECLKYCRYCKNRAFNNELGIICSLSNAQATFEGSCPSYEEDDKEKSEDEHLKHLRSSRSNLSVKDSIRDVTSIFSFKGRAKRGELWAVTFSLAILGKLGGLIPDDAYESLFLDIVILVLAIIMIWAGLATNTRRCHDLGHNGFWQLIPFYWIWMAFVEGQSGENEYGSASDIL